MTRRTQSWIGIGILAIVGTALVLTGLRPPHHNPTVHITRAVSWANPPGSHSTGWQRERWIMANQPTWIQREWRAASCPPLKVNTEFYYFLGDGGTGNLVVNMPPARAEPPWWDAPIPPTGFPIAGRRGC